MNGDSVVANDQPGFRPGVSQAQSNPSNLSISVDNENSMDSTTNEDTFDTSKFYELMKTPTNESCPTLSWSEASNGKNNVPSVGPTTPTPTPTSASTSKNSSLTGSFLSNISASKVGRNPNPNLSPWNASVDNSLRLNLNLNSNSNSNSNMNIKNMNTEIFLNPAASQLNKRVTRFNSTPALRMSDDIGLLERYNNSTDFQTTPVYSQNYINCSDGSVPWMNQTRSQSQSHLQVQSQRSSTAQPKTSSSLSSSPTLWATNPPLSADDSNSSLRSSRFFPSPSVDSHQQFEDYDSPLVTQSRRTAGTGLGTGLGTRTPSAASAANTASNDFNGRSNSVGYSTSSLDFTSFNSMVPATPHYNTSSNNDCFESKFSYQPPYSTSAINSFQPQQATPLQYVHISSSSSTNCNNAKSNVSCFVDPLNKYSESASLVDDLSGDIEDKEYGLHNSYPLHLETRVQLESRPSSPALSEYTDISPTLPSASLLSPKSTENDELAEFEQFNDPKSMVLHYIHHIVTRHNSLIQSYIASLPINVPSDLAHRLINLVFYPIGKVLKCDKEDTLKNDVFVKYRIIAMVVESAVQNVKERASGPWRSVRFEIPGTGRESKMLIFYDDYEHDDSYKDDYGDLENYNSNSSNIGGGNKLDVSWYPEGFSSTFHRRGVNNFMFVRELQSKMIINRIRLGGGMISETGEFRVSVPVEELGINLENINNAADYLEGNNSKLKRSFMVNIDLRELDGKNTISYVNNNRDFRYTKNNTNGNNNSNNMNGNNNGNGNNSVRGGRGGSRGSSRGYHGNGKRGSFRGTFRGHKK